MAKKREKLNESTNQISTFVVDVESLYIRNYPSKNGAVIGVLSKNDCIECLSLDPDNEYVKIVDHSDIDKYCAKEFLKMIIS